MWVPRWKSQGGILLIYLLSCLFSTSLGRHSSKVVEFLKESAGTASSQSETTQAIIDAAKQHREAIRKHLGVGNKADGQKWLDTMVGFTNDASRKYVEQKLYNAVQNGKLTMAIMGISTTAGHDNHYNQSYPKVFERHFGTVLAAGGVELEVRNHAVGGFGVMPSHLCVKTMVGEDIDILGWDYQMMAPRGDCLVEHFARAAMLMENQPALLFWQGGVWLPPEGKFNQDLVKPVRSNQKQSCGGKWVVDSYAELGAHYGDLAAVLQYLRYLGDVDYLKEGTDPLYGDPEKGTLPKPDFDEPARPWGDRRRLARHHPGPTLHRVWGLVWSHAYLGVLMHALAHGTPEAQHHRVFFPPKGCVAKYCDKVTPVCATDMLPRSPTAPKLTDLAREGHRWDLIDVDGRKPEADRFGYVDLKMGLSGSSESGELVFDFTTEHDNMPVSICQVPCPWGRCKKGRAVLEGNVQFELDGSHLNEKDFPAVDKPGEFQPLVNKGTCFVIAKSIPKGNHALKITVTAPGGDAVVVSHLIHF